MCKVRSLKFIFSLYQRSKLNLVDLVGSDQVWKSSVNGQQLSEAKFINSSLHHLESVIIALQKFNGRSLRNSSRKKQTGKFSLRSSSATLIGATNVDVVPKPKLNEKLMSASAVELGRGRHRILSADCGPVHVPYRNSLLTMVLQDSLGESSLSCIYTKTYMGGRGGGEEKPGSKGAGKSLEAEEESTGSWFSKLTAGSLWRQKKRVREAGFPS